MNLVTLTAIGAIKYGFANLVLCILVAALLSAKDESAKKHQKVIEAFAMAGSIAFLECILGIVVALIAFTADLAFT